MYLIQPFRKKRLRHSHPQNTKDKRLTLVPLAVMATNGPVDIDSLPLPSTLDLPSDYASIDVGLLPQLPPVNISGEVPAQLHDIISSLPPPLPIDEYELEYELEYGPSTTTEPELESSTLADGEIPRFDHDEFNTQQYDFLRRTLSHSRRRYSARFKRPRPKSRPQESSDQSSLDLPGQNREESSLDYPRSPDHPLHQQQRSKALSARRPLASQKIRRVGHSSAYQQRPLVQNASEYSGCG